MEKLSRTQKKKAAQALQKMGERLIHLSDAQFGALSLPKDLLEAVALARKISSHEARRRQMQYIGRLMREMDAAQVEEALERITSGEEENKRQFKLVERWRDELVAGDEDRMEWLMEQFPAIEALELKRLVDAAQQKQSGANTKKAGRMLFRYLNRMAATG